MKKGTWIYQKELKEYAVWNGYERCFTDDREVAIKNALEQSSHIDRIVYVNNIDGERIARCRHGQLMA